jgi:hypothetical protein
LYSLDIEIWQLEKFSGQGDAKTIFVSHGVRFVQHRTSKQKPSNKQN